MELIKIFIEILAAVSGSLAAGLSILLFVRLSWPSPAFWVIKLYASALSPLFVSLGAFSSITGLATGSVFISLTGIYGLLAFGIHIFRVTRPAASPEGSEEVFGPAWQKGLRPEVKNQFLLARTVWKLPVVQPGRMEANISFATVPGTNRKLLCDVWQPPLNTTSSGLVFIYLHGGAWSLFDKDLGTRTFFKYLAAQGHVVMDVAFRLPPETDMMGMVSDVKRAIVWMKENAGTYSVNPDRIVLGGGSSGAHLALLAAYTANNPQFTPKELEGQDLGVYSVISLYGPADLKAMYYHTNQHLTYQSTPGSLKEAVPSQMPKWIEKKMGKEYYRLNMDKGFSIAGALVPLLGGQPDECPETYALYSPLSHVHKGCPPTLLVHGDHDVLAPVASTRCLHKRLVEKKIPTVMHIIPQTDHAFDLIMPQLSPSAHNAFYDVERFLATAAAEQLPGFRTPASVMAIPANA